MTAVKGSAPIISGRVTDHRINLTLYKLEQFLDGEIDEVVNALITNAQAEQLKKVD